MDKRTNKRKIFPFYLQYMYIDKNCNNSLMAVVVVMNAVLGRSKSQLLNATSSHILYWTRS